MEKYYQITISARDGGNLIPEEALRRDGFLIGVFASNKTKAVMRGSGGSPSRKEYIVCADYKTAKAFAEDVVSRYLDYRGLSLLGIEDANKDDFEVSIKEIGDDMQSLEQSLMEMLSRSCQALGASMMFPGQFSLGLN